MFRKQLVAFLVSFGASTAIAAPPPPAETLQLAKTVLEELEEVPTKGIPRALLADAEAVAIIPNTVKAGFVIGGRVGHGVVILKEKDGWGDIRFITLGGASVGFQVGVQVSDVVLVFKTRKGLDRILDGKAKLTLGADAAVAAGPVGRDAALATDAKLKSEIWSYSRSRGLFAGVSLDGVVLASDRDTNDTFTKDSGEVSRKAADALKKKVSQIVVEKVPVLPPATVPMAPPATVPADLPPPGVQVVPATPLPEIGPIIVPTRQPLWRRLFGKGK